MDSRYQFLTLGIPWAHSMPSRDVNAATRLAEASWRLDNVSNPSFCTFICNVGLYSVIWQIRNIYLTPKETHHLYAFTVVKKFNWR